MRTFDTSLPNERPTHDTSKAVCQSVVDEYTTGKREYLGFVLQTAEGGREDKAVIVTLEFRAVFMAFPGETLPVRSVWADMSVFQFIMMLFEI